MKVGDKIRVKNINLVKFKNRVGKITKIRNYGVEVLVSFKNIKRSIKYFNNELLLK